MEKLVELRQTLHRNAELSGKEYETAKILSDSIEKLNPDLLYRNVGGNGILAVFDSAETGPNILFRADIDALPIHENTALDYKSFHEGISHKCGHDGHSTILFGFAEYLATNRPRRGKVYLLFQPAEETGDGALNVIREIKSLNIDYSFALHNLPGLPLHSIVYRYNTFCCASTGVIIDLKGISAHASEPEKGISPANALAYLIKELPSLSEGDFNKDDYSLITVVHASLGKESFGIAPSDAKLFVTLRSLTTEMLDRQSRKIEEIVSEISKISNLEFKVRYLDRFPAMVNNKEAVDFLKEAALSENFQMIEKEEPFRWSEDFAHFSSISKAVLFGVGVGENHLPLHNPDYDFKDEVIPTGVNIWKSILSVIDSLKVEQPPTNNS